jgi:WD40 repeat protein
MLNVRTGKIIQTFTGHSKAVLCSDFSADGKRLITGSGDNTIKLWDVETGTLINTFKGHSALIFDVKFSSDNKHIISGSWDGSLRIWDTKTAKSLQYIKLEEGSPYCLEFTPNDLYVVSGDLGKSFKLFEVDAGKEFRNIVGHTDLVSEVCFSPDGKQMVSASLDGKVKVWDLLSGMLVNKFSGHTSGVYTVAYHPDGKFIASGSNDRTIKIWNPITGKEIKTLTGHSGAITSIKISSDGTYLYSCSIDGEIKVWNLDDFTERYTYIQIDKENWLAKNPQGYFDGSAMALKQINYVSGLNVISIGSLFEKYYTPNLIKRIQEGENFTSNTTSIQDLIKNKPIVQLSLFPEIASRDIALPDSLEWFKDSVSVSMEVASEEGNIDELRLYNNGKLIYSNKTSEEIKAKNKNYKTSFTFPLVTGENTITAIAFNKDRTESQPSQLNIYYDGIESDIDLYLLSIGINKYLNPTYELNYALNDAKAYSKMIKKSAGNLFSSVKEYTINDNDANKSGIQEIFSEISKNAGPEDIFIFYFAGHGAMNKSENGSSEFYIIPYDVTNLYGDNEALKEKAISADELLTLSKQIAARKQMYVLDACQAGGALEAFNTRGADREKAIAQLARSSGTFFLLASGAIQYASEAKELGHGIFTYAILEGLEGKADGGLQDEKITANELKSYVEDRVPELTDKYMLTPQYPTGYSFGQDFPIVIVK